MATSDGSDLHWLSASTQVWGTFSPDGRYLAVAGDGGLAVIDTSTGLFDDGGFAATAVPGGADRVQFADGGHLLAAWVPNGLNADKLEVFHLPDTTPTLLGVPPKGYGDGLTFSPNQSHAAFLQSQQGTATAVGPLFLADLDGGGGVQVASAVLAGGGFAFSADGQALYFVETFDGGSEGWLERVPVAGGAPQVLKSAVDPHAIAVTPHGAAISRCERPGALDFENGVYLMPAP